MINGGGNARRSREGGNVIFLRGTGGSVPREKCRFSTSTRSNFLLEIQCLQYIFCLSRGYLPGEVLKRHSVYKYSLDSTN